VDWVVTPGLLRLLVHSVPSGAKKAIPTPARPSTPDSTPQISSKRRMMLIVVAYLSWLRSSVTIAAVLL
jgi:hypothetical protein